MFWFFQREKEELRYEIRQNTDGLYELIITYPDGMERIERFETSAELTKRSLELNRSLQQDGWKAIDSRH